MSPPSSSTGFTEVSKTYTSELNAAQSLFREEQYEACIQACKELLKKDDLSSATKIRTLILWCDATDDWWEAEECRRAAESSWTIAFRLMSGSGNEAVEASLRDLRELLDDALRTQREHDPTKPIRDAAGNIIIRGRGEDAGEKGKETLAYAIWKEGLPQITREEVVARCGQKEAKRIFGREGKVDMPSGPSLTAEELAAIVERKMAGEPDPETSAGGGKSQVGGSLPAEGGGDKDRDGDEEGDGLESGAGAGSGSRSGYGYGGGPDNLEAEADGKLAEYTASVARWRSYIPEEEREQYDKVTTDLLACQKETVDVFKATMARMRR